MKRRCQLWFAVLEAKFSSRSFFFHFIWSESFCICIEITISRGKKKKNKIKKHDCCKQWSAAGCSYKRGRSAKRHCAGHHFVHHYFDRHAGQFAQYRSFLSQEHDQNVHFQILAFLIYDRFAGFVGLHKRWSFDIRFAFIYFTNLHLYTWILISE